MYGLFYQCDEGFYEFTDVFTAQNKQSIYEFMLAEIKNYLEWLIVQEGDPYSCPPEYEKGRGYWFMLNRVDWNCVLDISVPSYELEQKAKRDFFLTTTWKSIESLVENSYIDGDSYFQISIIKIEPTVNL